MTMKMIKNLMKKTKIIHLGDHHQTKVLIAHKIFSSPNKSYISTLIKMRLYIRLINKKNYQMKYKINLRSIIKDKSSLNKNHYLMLYRQSRPQVKSPNPKCTCSHLAIMMKKLLKKLSTIKQII